MAARWLAPVAAAAVGAAVLGGGTAVSPATASDLPDTLPGVDYSCEVSGLFGVPFPFALHVDPLGPITVPLGRTLSALTIPTGLAPAIERLASVALTPVFEVGDVTFLVADTVQVAGSVDATGAFAVPTLALPADAVPGDELPIRAPQSFATQVVGGVLGTVGCVLDATGSDVVGTILVGPAATDTTIVSVDPPPRPGSGSSGGGGTAGQRHLALHARLAHASVRPRARAVVRARVAASDGSSVAGRVRVRSGGRTLGSARVVGGAAAVRLRGLPVGRYRLKVSSHGLRKFLVLWVTR